MNPQDNYREAFRPYCAGLLMAVALTAIPTVLVMWGGLSAFWTLAAVLLFTLLQIVVHLRCFLHVGTARSRRDELWLVLFTALVVLLMAGGTLVVFYDQMGRM
jgi:cytochrome o ubiquinol oxidase operon protein cyoD